MMRQNVRPGNGESAGTSDSGHLLLRDIEEISKALYLNKPPSMPPSDDVLSKSALTTSKSSVFPRILNKEKKFSSSWNWKKPLKALAHVGHRKFSICFFLHVHSIEGLHTSLNDFNLRVHWKRKEEVLQTRPSRVDSGVVQFDETLMHNCYVYGSRSGPHQSAKYKEKQFLIYVSVVEAPGFDIGKQRVDLTRLLPITLDDLLGDKNSGKWTTSFKLTGKAAGATLNVSFSFVVPRDNLVEPHSRHKANISELVKYVKNRPAATRLDTNHMLRRPASVPSDDDKHWKASLSNFELSRSISLLHQKLEEGNTNGSKESSVLSENVLPLKPKSDLDFAYADGFSGDEHGDDNFVVVDKGVEMLKNELPISLQSNVDALDASAIDTIDVNEIMKNDDMKVEVDSDNYMEEIDSNYYVNKLEEDCINDSSIKMQENDFLCFISESADLEAPRSASDFPQQDNDIKVISSYKTSKIGKKTHSLDDITESVASDFLDMLGIEQTSSDPGSGSDPESPRECLLRAFEKESFASGNFLLEYYPDKDHKFGCFSPEKSRCDLSEDFDFSSPSDEKRASQLLSRRKVKELEDLETEALMRDWGLNEKAFQNSPCNCSDGFGSPIELSPKSHIKLPPLGDGFGSLIKTKGGGYLRSMNPSLFRKSNHVRSLIMQVSNPIVLPAEMGSDIIEILLHLSSVGIEKLSTQSTTLMPMVEVTGKTIGEIYEEGETSKNALERETQLQQKLFLGNFSFTSSNDVEGLSSGLCCDNPGSNFLRGEMGVDIVSFEDLIPSAMNQLEFLAIKGLRIQSGMSDEESPASISCQSAGKMFSYEEKENGLDGLFGLSITLTEWLSLDGGIIAIDEDQVIEHTMRILAAHHANYVDFDNERFKKDSNWENVYTTKPGLLGNNLTIGFMVVLRDPQRNYEPVGSSMLALVQAERVILQHEPKLSGGEDEMKDYSVWFKIIEVHLVGLDVGAARKQIWGSIPQQLSGTRWLLANGMGKTFMHPISKSKAIVVSNAQARTKLQTDDIIWSISTHTEETQTNLKNSTGINACVRNPNVIFDY